MLASAGVLWFSQRTAIESVRSANRGLNAELAGARAGYEETIAALTNAQALLALRSQEVELGRNDVAVAADTTKATPIPPDPASEGLWPKDKPYCYLSKQHLATIEFIPFCEDGPLTSEAAILFGMSAAEKLAIDNATADFIERTHQLHIENAELIDVKPGTNTENHRETTYRVPMLTNEFRALRSAFDASTEQILGNSRASVFLKRGQKWLDEGYGQYENTGYTIKYSADRQPDGTVRHELDIKRLDGMAGQGLRVRFPIDPTSGMWKYRHLFGDGPLLE